MVSSASTQLHHNPLPGTEGHDPSVLPLIGREVSQRLAALCYEIHDFGSDMLQDL